MRALHASVTVFPIIQRHIIPSAAYISTSKAYALDRTDLALRWTHLQIKDIEPGDSISPHISSFPPYGLISSTAECSSSST